MTAYILDIDKPEAIYTIRIRRFNPDTDRQSHWETYEVPFVKTMTVIEALEYLWDQGEYIAFRANCREFTCGSCAMLINGKPMLACSTLLKDSMTLEPLTRYPLVRDLVVDTGAVTEKLKQLQYWPVNDGQDGDFTVSRKVSQDFAAIYSRCIECLCCLEACPASASEVSKFDGPMHVLQLARAGLHPMDTMDRVEQANGRGTWACVSCFECADVCPIDLVPGEEIVKFRKKAVKKAVLKMLGIGDD